MRRWQPFSSSTTSRSCARSSSAISRAPGYHTLEAADGHRARGVIEERDVDLVVLDLMLPGIDGLELCRWIRGRSELPVIMLTARGEEADRIVGLELGADDYVTKPFSPRELAARVRSVLRRAGPAGAAVATLRFGEVELERETREVRKAGSRVRLTAKEFDLLWFLASHPRRVFSRDELMSKRVGLCTRRSTRERSRCTCAACARRSRTIRPQPRHLETVWGVGYRLAA